MEIIPPMANATIQTVILFLLSAIPPTDSLNHSHSRAISHVRWTKIPHMTHGINGSRVSGKLNAHHATKIPAKINSTKNLRRTRIAGELYSGTLREVHNPV